MIKFALLQNTYLLLSIVALLSFMESLFLPLAMELLLIPLMIKHFDARWRIALWAFAGSMVGALAAYYIGHYFYAEVGEGLLRQSGMLHDMEDIERELNSYGFWWIVSIGLTPVPFQVATYGAGVTQFSLWEFLAAVALARGIRYAALTGLIGWLIKEDRIQKVKIPLVSKALAEKHA